MGALREQTVVATDQRLPAVLGKSEPCQCPEGIDVPIRGCERIGDVCHSASVVGPTLATPELGSRGGPPGHLEHRIGLLECLRQEARARPATVVVVCLHEGTACAMPESVSQAPPDSAQRRSPVLRPHRQGAGGWEGWLGCASYTSACSLHPAAPLQVSCSGSGS